MCSVPRSRAELPLADAIKKDVAQCLSSPDDVLVKTTMPPLMSPLTFLPSSPLAGRASRMPTSSSSEGWEFVGSNASRSPRSSTLAGIGSQDVLDVRTVRWHKILSDEEMIEELEMVQRTRKDRQLPSSSLTMTPFKAPPKPPFNTSPPPRKAAPGKAAPAKAAPTSMGPPPVTPPFKSPPKTKPSSFQKAHELMEF